MRGESVTPALIGVSNRLQDMAAVYELDAFDIICCFPVANQQQLHSARYPPPLPPKMLSLEIDQVEDEVATDVVRNSLLVQRTELVPEAVRSAIAVDQLEIQAIAVVVRSLFVVKFVWLRAATEVVGRLLAVGRDNGNLMLLGKAPGREQAEGDTPQVQ